MSGFDTPPIINSFLIVWLLLFAVLFFWGLRHLQRVVAPSYQMLLYGLRFAAAVIVLLLLLQPYFEYKKADPQSFQVAILADCSQSMSVEDGVGNESRLSNVQEALGDNSESLLNRLDRNYRTRVFLFSDKLYDFHNNTLSSLPGNTSLGNSLNALVNEYTRTTLGAVVLLSDGHNNAGPAGTAAAQEFKNRGIPITCIGVGSQRQMGDVAVEFLDQQKQTTKDEPFSLQAQVSSTLPEAVQANIKIESDNVVLDQRAVTLAPGDVMPLEFEVVPWQAGFQTYKIHVDQLPNDRRRDTDIDFIGIEVAEPAVFRVLYMGANLNWEYKFIKLVADTTEQLAMSAVIRTGTNVYYTHQLPAAADKGFPEKEEVFNQYDAVILDLRALPFMSEETLLRLRNFVEFRGGGLLAMGPLETVPTDLLGLLPVSQVDNVKAQRTMSATLSDAFIFNNDPTGLLESGRGVQLQAGLPYFSVTERKPGARIAATFETVQRDLLLAQAYGSGRTAYLSVENSWRWRLRNEVGRDVHSGFWKALMVWLGSAGKERFQADIDGQKIGIGEKAQLDLTVLGTDFRPAENAQVSARVTSPGGTTETILLNPSVAGLGKYTGTYFPGASGEYSVKYQVDIAGQRSHYDAHFVARQTGLEAQDTGYQENTLRDIARITGGRFLPYAEQASLSELPLSSSLPLEKRRNYWARSWWMFLLLATVLSTDWYCRRRIGLK